MKDAAFLELEQALGTTTSGDACWSLCTDAFADIGVSGIGYGVVPLRGEAAAIGNTQAVFFRHSYGPEWEATFGASEVLDNDVTVDLLAAGHSEVFWHQTPEDGISEAQKRQWHIEDDLGMAFGVSLLLVDPRLGSVASGLGLCMSDVAGKDFDRYWQSYGSTARRMAHTLDYAMRGIARDALVQLSPRETDCLTYLAIGLRPDEIAFRLRISPKSLEKYVA